MKKTTKCFIEEAQAIHGNKYDYSKAKYINNQIKVEIICPDHGEFWQTPNNHLRGSGCPKCKGVKLAKERNLTIEQFIKKAKEVHGDKYDYSLVDYKNTYTKVKIICLKHGIFEQAPHYHLSGNGCPYCSCKTYKGEKKIENWLINEGYIKNKDFFLQKKFDGLKNKRKLSYDFYIPSKNLLIEYNGEQHYEPKCFGGISFEKAKKKLKKQYHCDWLKRKYAMDNNIKLLTISYKEFKIIENILEENIKS